jgi:hypothetical protein
MDIPVFPAPSVEDTIFSSKHVLGSFAELQISVTA